MKSIIRHFFMLMVALVLTLVLTPAAQAQEMTFHGRLVDSVTNLGLNGNILFRIQIRTPNTAPDSCLMYEEQVTRTVTNGVYTIRANSGAGAVTLINGYTLEQVFSNKNSFGAFNLPAGACNLAAPLNWTPNPADSRVISISFNDPLSMAPGTWEPLPTQVAGYVPMAIEALNVGGHPVDSLLRVVNAGAPQSVAPFSNAQYNELINTLTGTSSYYLASGTPAVGFTGYLNGDVSGTQGATSVMRIRGIPVVATAPAVGQVLTFDGASWAASTDGGGTVTSVSSTNAYLSVATPNTTPLLTLNVGTVANTVAAGNDARIVNSLQLGSSATGDLTGTYPAPTVATVGGRTAAQISTSVGDTIAATNLNTPSTIVKRDASGNAAFTTVQATNFSANNLYLYNASGTQYAQLKAPNLLGLDYIITLPSTAPVSGSILVTNASGDLTWTLPSALGVTNVTASAPLASTGGSTPNISISQAASSTSGFLSSTDWTTFNNKQSTNLTTGMVWVGNASGTSSEQFLNITNVRSAVIPTVNPFFNVAGGCPAGQTLTYNAISDQVSCAAYSITSSQVTTALGYTPTSNALAPGNIFVGNASGTATGVAMSGDATIDVAGVITISNNAIINAKIANLAITNAKINDVHWNKVTSTPTTIAGYGITDAILVEAGGVDDMQADIFANRPAAAAAPFRVYVSSDTGEVWYSNGVTWTLVGSAVGLGGTVTNVSANGPLSVVSGSSTPVISISQANTATNGYLSSSDWNTFNNKIGPALASGNIIVGNAGGVATAVSMTGDATLSNTGALTLANTGVASGTYTRITIDTKGRVISATQLISTDVTSGLGYTPVNRAGDTMTGALNLPANGINVGAGQLAVSGTNVVMANRVGVGTGTPNASAILELNTTALGFLMPRMTSVQRNGIGAPAIGLQVFNTDTNTVDFYNGITWLSMASTSGSISTLNGLTTQNQLFATSTSGTDFTITSSSATHTFNFPSASAGARGLLTSADWTTFNNKLSTTTMFAGDVSGTYNSITLNNTGVSAGTYTRVQVDAKGRVVSGSQLTSGDVSSAIGYVPVESVTVDPPLLPIVDPKNPIITLLQASTFQDGFLSSGDFTTFSNKVGPATVFSGDITGTYNNISLINIGVASGTYTKVTVDTKGRVIAATNLVSTDVTSGLGYTPVNRAGDTMSGALNLPANGLNVGGGQLAVSGTNVVMANRVGIGTGSPNASAILELNTTSLGFLMPRMTAAQRNGIGAPVVGLQVFNTDTNSVDYYNGVTWLSLASTSGSISTLNGLTTQNQVFATGTTGSDFNISSSSATHTFNFPNAAANARGLLSSADWSIFNNKLTSALPSGQIFVGNASGTATAVTMSGDASINNTGSVTLVTIAGVSGTYGSATAVPSFTVDSKGRITLAGSQAYADATAVTKGIVQIGVGLSVASGTVSANFGNTSGTITQGNDSRLSDARAPTGPASGDLTGTYPNPTIANDAVTNAKIANLAVTNAKINDVNWNKVTSTPTTISGYGITDAILTNAGGVQTMQAGTLAARPAPGGVNQRVYLATDTGEISLSNGVTWSVIATASGTGGTVTNVTAGFPLSVTSNTTTPVISIPLATSSAAGYLASADWTTFNNKLNNSLTTGNIWIGVGNIPTAVTMAGDATLNTSGTLTLSNTGVSAGNYTRVAVDAKGRVVSGTNLTSSDISNYLGYTPVESVSVDPPFVPIVDPKNPIITLLQASTTEAGFLASADFTTFNNKLGTTTIFGGDVSGTYNSITLNNSGVTAGTYARVAVDAKGRVVSGSGLVSTDITSGLGYTPVNRAGDTMSGSLNLPSNGLNVGTGQLVVSGTNVMIANRLGVGTNSPNVSAILDLNTTSLGFLMPRMTTAQRNAIGTPATGLQIYNTDSNSVDYYNGGIWLSFASTAGALQNLNGLTAVSQTFAVGNTGSDFNIVSSGTVHSFNIPNSSAAARGLLSSADWSTFNAKLSTTTVFGGDVSGTYNAITLNNTGVTSGNYTRVAVDAKGRVVSGTNLTSSDITNYLGYTPVESVSVDPPFVSIVDPKNPIITLLQASTTEAGFLASADFTTFNNKLGTTTIFGGDVSGTYNAITLNNSGVAAGTYTRVAVDAKGRVVSGSAMLSTDVTAALGYTPVNRAGDTMSGALNLPSNGLNVGTGQFAVSGTNVFVANKLGVGTGNVNASALFELNSTAAGFLMPRMTAAQRNAIAAPATGLQVFNTDTNSLDYYNGASWVSAAASGSAIVSLNGLSGVSQTFAVGSAGSDFAINSAGNVHTFNIPNSSLTARGLLSSADYTTFNNKLGPATAFSGDVTGTYNNTVLANSGVTAGTYQRVTVDAKGRVTAGAASVDLTYVSGTLGVANGGTGATSIGSGNIVIGGGTGAVTSLAAGTAGNIVYATGAATWSSASPDTANIVDKSSTQLISGDKSFASFVSIRGQNSMRLNDADNSNYVALRSPANLTSGDITFTLPGNAGANGQVLATDGAGVLSWTTAMSNVLNDGQIWVGSAGNVATPRTISGDGTINNAGNFTLAATGVAAGNYTRVAVDTKGRVVSGTNLTSSDISSYLGYVPVESVSVDPPFVPIVDPKNPIITLLQASTTEAGFLASADFTTFNNKLGTTTIFGGDVSGTYNAITLNNTGVGAGVYTKVNVDTKGRVVSATSLVSTDITSSLGYTPVNRAGDTMSGALNLPSNGLNVGTGQFAVSGTNVFVANKLGVGTGNVNASALFELNSTAAGFLMPRMTTAQRNGIGTPATGLQVFNTDTNTVDYYNGGSWVSVTTGGITSLNGLSGVSQTFAVGSAGSDFAINSAGNVHTFNIPNASAANNRGLLTSSDWSAFNAKLSTTTVFGGDVSGTYNAITLNNTGVSAGNYTRVAVDSKGRVVSGTNLTSSDISSYLGYVPVESVSVDPPFVPIVDPKNPIITLLQASTTEAGFLASADFTTFNNKLGTTTIFGGDVSGTYNAITLNNTGVGAGVYTKVNVDTKGRVVSATSLVSTDITSSLGYTPVNRAGDTMSGALNLPSNGLNVGTGQFAVSGTNVFVANKLGVGTGNVNASALFELNSTAAGFLMPRMTTAQRNGIGTPATGLQVFNTDTNTVDYYNGGSWITLSTGGIVGLNGLSGVSQTFAIGSTGSDFNIVSSGTIHSFNFPSAANNARGLLTSADWTTFNAKLGTATTFSGDVSGTYNAITLNNTGVTAGNYTKVNVDAKGRVVSGTALVSADITTALTYTPVQSVTGNFPFAAIVDPRNPILSLSAADANTAGYLASADWSTFNAKLGTGTSFSGDVTGTYNNTVLSNTGVGAGVYTKVNVDTKGRVVSATSLVSTDITSTLGYTPVNRAGDTMSGALNLPSNGLNVGTGQFAVSGTNVFVANKLGVGTGNVNASALFELNSTAAGFLMPRMTAAQRNAIAAPATGLQVFNTDTNSLDYYNGASWVSAAASGSAIVSLNGLSGVSQTFAVGSAGSDFAINSAGNVHTFNIPNSSLTARGLLASADFTTFNNKLGTTTIFGGDVSGTYNAITLNNTGVTAGNYTKVNVDAKGRVVSGTVLVSADITTALTYTPVQSVTGNFPFAAIVDPRNPILSLSAADANTAGYLASADWSLFNAKLGTTTSFSGDVTGTYNNTILANTGVGAGVYTKVNVDAKGRVVSATSLVSADITSTLGYTPVNRAGDTMSGALNLPSNGLNVGTGQFAVSGTNVFVANKLGVGTGNVNVSALFELNSTAAGFLMPRMTTAQRNGIGTPATGLQIYNTDNNTVDYYNGGSWVALYSGSAISTLNGLSGVSQTFAVGSAGSDFAINSAGNVHTFNIPNSSLTTRGLLASADFTTFNNKLGTTTIFGGDVSGTYNAITLNNTGVTAGNYTKVNVDAKGRVVSGTALVSADITTALTYTPVQSVTGNFPFAAIVDPRNPILSLSAADANTAGYLASADWSLFNAKLGTTTSFSGDVTGTYNNTVLSNTGVGAGVYTKVNVDTKGRVVSATSLVSTDITSTLGYTPVNRAGDTMSGALNLPSNGLNVGTGQFAVSGTNVFVANKLGVGTGNVNVSALFELNSTAAGFLMPRMTTAQRNGIGTPATGLQIYNTDNNTVDYYNGGSWVALYSGSAISTLNGLSGVSQTFAVGSAGSDFAINSAGNVHTFNIPNASAANNRGLLTSSDWSAFNAKLSTTTVFGGDVSGTYNAITLNNTGVTAGNYTKVNVDAKGRVVSGTALVSADITTALTYTPVQSVTASFPFAAISDPRNPILTLSAANSTTAGYLASADWSTFNAKLGTGTSFSGDVTGTYNNTVLANSGVTAGTYQRVTVDAKGRVTAGAASVDLTYVSGTLDVAYGGTGATSIGAGNLVVGGGTGAVTSLAAGTAGNIVYATGIATWSSGSPDTAGIVDKSSTQLISGDKSFASFVSIRGQNSLRLNDSDNSNYVALRSPANLTSGDITFTLPGNAGTSGQVLATNGAGVLSWANALSSSLTDGQMWVGNSSNVATARTISGDGTINNVGNFSLATTGVTAGTYQRVTVDTKGRVTSAAASVDLTYVSGTLGVANGGTGLTTGTSGGIPYFSGTTTMASSAALTQNGVLLGGGAGAAPTATASGTANSVLRVPAGGGAPSFGQIDLTSSAVVAIQTAGRFYAGPASGVSTTPTFRSIVSSDISSVGFVNGGNTFGAASYIGNADNFNLNFETNGITRMNITNAGAINFSGDATFGVAGTSSPVTVSKMEVNGQGYSKVLYNNTATTTLAWNANQGNVMRWETAAASGTVNVTNAAAGASYMLVVKGAGTSTITITCNGGGSKYVPTNGNRVGGAASSKTVYTFIYDGEECLVTWITGY